MNSTSADDTGGRIPVVDDGSVLLGEPGAPGCTTTGFAGYVRCAWAAKEKKIVKTVTASNLPRRVADPSL
ncbi:MAG: hypothetical protein WAL32_09785 [Terriglobales bacterium]